MPTTNLNKNISRYIFESGDLLNTRFKFSGRTYVFQTSQKKNTKLSSIDKTHKVIKIDGKTKR